MSEWSRKADYYRVILYIVLRRGGMEEEDALYCIMNPEDLFEIIQEMAKEKGGSGVS